MLRRVAVVPRAMEVDPGDGASTMTCDVRVTRSDACAYVYRRASRDPAGHAARLRITDDLRFELNGQAVDIPAAPTSPATGWQGVSGPVVEVRTLVVPGG